MVILFLANYPIANKNQKIYYAKEECKMQQSSKTRTFESGNRPFGSKTDRSNSNHQRCFRPDFSLSQARMLSPDQQWH